MMKYFAVVLLLFSSMLMFHMSDVETYSSVGVSVMSEPSCC